MEISFWLRRTGRLRGLDQFLVDLFSPQCPACLCKTYQSGICPKCRDNARIRGSICELCGYGFSASVRICGECLNARGYRPLQTRSSFWLTPEMTRVVHRVKAASELVWFESLISSMHINEFPGFISGAVLVPIPGLTSRFLDRGYHPASLMAEAMQFIIPGTRLVTGLERLDQKAAQSTLNRKQRIKNVQLSWSSRVSVPEKLCLIDDVATTGSTLKSAARACARAGVQKVYAWTAFRTPKPY